MSRHLSRLTPLARRFESAEAMVARSSLITGSLGVPALGIGVPTALVGRAKAEVVAQASPSPRRPASILDDTPALTVTPAPMRPIALVTISLLSVAAFLLGAAAPPGLEPQAAGQPGGAKVEDRPAAKQAGQAEIARSWLYLREDLAQDLARFLRNYVAEVKVRAIPDPEKMFDPEPFDRLVFAGEPRAVRAVEDFAKLFQGPPAGSLMVTAMIEETLLAEGREKEVLEGRARSKAERRPVEAAYRLSPVRARAVAALIGRHALVPIRARAKEGKLLVACSTEDHRRLAPILSLLGAERLDAEPAGG